VSFWSVQHHTQDIWAAVGNGTINAGTGSISGSVFNDVDADGIRDVGEGALAGRIVYDDTNNDGKRQGYEPFARTDSNGNFTIAYRGAWLHRVRLDGTSGWRQTLPKNSLSASTFLNNAQQATGFTFGATPLAQISGTVFNDRNADGSKGSGEGSLVGWTVYLDANRNGALDAGEASTLSDSRGNYVFNVPAGSYQVREIPAAGYRITSPSKTFYDLTVAAGEATTRFFGNSTNVLISGYVFNDKNANGTKDAGENALAGWRVFVDLDGDGVFDSEEPSALTDATGKYRLNSVGGGTWRIQVALPNKWVATVPGSAARKITLASGGTTSNKNFGVTPIA
jgi:hypothetical protein